MTEGGSKPAGANDWRSVLGDRWLRIGFAPHADHDGLPEDDDEADDETYRRTQESIAAITRDAANVVSGIRVATAPDDDDDIEAFGGADVIDFVYLALGGYASLRVVIDDLRTLVATMREHKGSYIELPPEVPMLVAWDHVAPPGSHSVVDVTYVGEIHPTRAHSKEASGTWFVGLVVDHEPALVVVSQWCEVLATIPGIDASVLENAYGLESSRTVATVGIHARDRRTQEGEPRN